MESYSGMTSAGSDAIGFPQTRIASRPVSAIRVSSDSSILPFFTRHQPLWKRTMDIVGASAFLFLFWPFFIIIGGIIKLSSPGPAFFKQIRIGYRGKPFEFIKFRTMDIHCNVARHRQYLKELISDNESGSAPGTPMVKLDRCNPDIFPFGRFLRKTCLDELPQLINVLRGEMSLVGPRPPIPYEVGEYGGWHNGRFDTVPGMTGLWQVSGKNRLSFREMVRLDIRYAQNLSPLEDLRILLLTPCAIVSEVFRCADTRPVEKKEAGP